MHTQDKRAAADLRLMMETQPESAQRLYDRRAKEYNKSWHPAFAKRVVELAGLKPGEHVLDLACGTGLVTFHAAAAVGPTGHIVAVDISKGMLDEATSMKTALGATNVDIYQHDITHLEPLEAIRGASFDAITLASAFVLLEDPWAAVKHWATFLKPGGRMIVDVPSPHNLVVGLTFERVGRRLGKKIPYYRDWVKSPDSLQHLIESAGLIVENMELMGQTGAGIEYLKLEDAHGYFDAEVGGAAVNILAADDIREQARALFLEEWEKMAVDGVVKREDLVYVAIARKAK